MASKDTETASIEEHLKGPCALAITYEDLIGPAKALVGLGKQHEKLEIKVGQMSGRAMDPAAIKRLAELPGRDELLAQVFSAMQAVPTSLVRVLSAVLSSFMNVLKAIEGKKDEEQKEATS
jgi:large subunit ribosomal protein L10